jgi:hypothetical protein
MDDAWNINPLCLHSLLISMYISSIMPSEKKREEHVLGIGP